MIPDETKKLFEEGSQKISKKMADYIISQHMAELARRKNAKMTPEERSAHAKMMVERRKLKEQIEEQLKNQMK